MKRSLLIFLFLIGYLALVKISIGLFEIQFAHPSQAESFSWMMIAIALLLGTAGIFASPRAGFPYFWDPAIPLTQKFILPVAAGFIFGLVGISIDQVFDLSKTIAAEIGTDSVHIPFPSSAVVYPAAAILVSVFQYLVPIPIIVWIISNIVLRGRFQKQVFLVVGVLAALLEPISQAAILKENPSLLILVFLFVFCANLTHVYFFRKAGFLALLFVRLSFYVVWHVAGPGLA